jgi:dTDP-4-amino-4,6-dideoxygalactose transaminase
MKLAINGGKNIRQNAWPTRFLYNKDKIKETVCNIIDSDNLSGYRGSFGQHFWGGEYVKALETYIEDYYFERTGKKVKVLAVNSCTSALHIACGAIDLNYGQEVIVTPWSMTCSATAPMLYKAKPVFADIEKDFFCLDSESIKEKITPNTKAIISVDLFGNPHNYEAINKIAKENNLYVIEDCAQALGASFDGLLTGMLGDIGCFSFTQGKHFTCGEGGLIITQNEDLYMKCALLRNHVESVINSMPDEVKFDFCNFENQYGFNMRMTEIQAAILLEQFKGFSISEFHSNIDLEVDRRKERVFQLQENINLDFIEWGKVRDNCEHSYYVLPFIFNEKIAGITRSKFIQALKAELRIEKTSMGVTEKTDPLIWEGYIKPLYEMPIFCNNYFYTNVSFPIVEELQNKSFCFTTFQSLPLDQSDIYDISKAFHKVAQNINELKE